MERGIVLAGGGALLRDFYGPGAAQVPNDWIHNLEHGYAVIAPTWPNGSANGPAKATAKGSGS